MEEPQCLAARVGAVAVFTTGSPARAEGNQDAAAVISAPEGRLVLAVADGVGGQADGDRVAGMVLTRLAEALSEVRAEDPLRQPILDAIERANREIHALGTGAATTVAVAAIEDGRMRSFHAGDSSVLVIGGRGRIRKETIPHSPVGYAQAAGLLTEETALHHPERHLIDNAVGSPDLRIEVGSEIRLAPRDSVLLATDGLLDNVRSRELRKLCPGGHLSAAASALARLARDRMIHPQPGAPSKPDDLTFLLYRPRS
ncbi:MAG: protein phosphatase 2C domain-containing protein [Myxococcota bacterium]|nr:protein phosphatase 2C domain-containing protein [Myxococcota bacterium]